MIFDYDKFIRSIHQEYKDKFSLDEIKELLDINGDYNKDTPISTGKRLFLTKISIKGQKTNGAIIDFTHPFESGINLIIADNLRGKSSLFKMIQIALTGNNKLKPDVKKWIKMINLGFKINDKNYSAIIRFNNSRMSGSLYSQNIDDVSDSELNKLTPVFWANSIPDYEKNIQEFFFKQFSYYSLKWTQKASQKDKNELNEAKASWKTYFKSIYLESKDSSSLMYGGQGKKVFQMLLGLDLTYAINYLTVKHDMLTFNKAKEKEYSVQNEKDKNEKTHLQIRKEEIEHELISLNTINHGSLIQLYEEYEGVIDKINFENSIIINNAKKANEKWSEINSINSKINSYTSELKRINKEVVKTIRYINDLEEYIEVGSFFTNLEIKHCPSCNHKVKNNQNSDKKTCSLCHEGIEDPSFEINKEIFYQKITALKNTLNELKKEENILKTSIHNLNEEQSKVKQSYLELDTIKIQNNISNLKDQLKVIENKIDIEKRNSNDNRKMNLTAEKAVIEFQLSKLGVETNDYEQNKENKKIPIINRAIEKLNSYRYESSKHILKYLSENMLEELHQFGLTSITEININENFEIKYKQDGEYIAFDDIAEGEQLRAKIAFYLALIQLDIENNFGRHTRFLILDSPNKEEGDSQYLNGLTKTLKNIDKRYGDKLQIIIGTAERQLEKKVGNEKTFEKGIYVF
jgi:DNA repair exonuclease SbcCD ATPase subunit